MMFEIAVSLILKLEGGLVDHPRDPGGITNHGISLRAHPYIGREGIKTLTKDKAKKIYFKHYWEPIKGDHLPPELAVCVFDGAVNQGVVASAKILQSVVGATVDGVIGPKTLSAVTANYYLKGNDLILDFMSQRMMRYVRTDGFGEFGRGWTKRVLHVCQFSAALKSVAGLGGTGS